MLTITNVVWHYGGSQNPVGGGGASWGPGDLGSDEYDALVQEAAVERDPAARVELYAQAEQILVDTAAIFAPIYWYTDLTLTKPYVVRSYPVTGHNDFTDWDITQ
jgi:oligopeptide transport system substrate-binding protein